MNINDAILARITQLCQERNISPTLVLPKTGEDITLEAVDAICAELQITVADFFNSDLFRNLKHS